VICPNPDCKRDLYDVPRHKMHGYVHKTDPSDGLPYIRRGRVCTNCGFMFETIERATGAPYHKRAPGDLPNQLKMFDDPK